MKKALALMLAVAFCAACFVLTTGAVAENELSFLPNDKSNNTATGCEYKINDDGSVTVTLTATSATLDVVFNDGSALLDNKINIKEDGRYVAVSYATTGNGALATSTITNYMREKEGQAQKADLYLESMAVTPDYAQFRGNEGENCFTWDLRAYLTSKSYVPASGETEIIETKFMFTGDVGDTITIYKYGIYADVPEDLGKEGEASTDESSEPADESSAAASEAESSAATSSAAASSTTESSKTPVTSDAGVAAIVVLAVVAAAGAAVVIRKRG